MRPWPLPDIELEERAIVTPLTVVSVTVPVPVALVQYLLLVTMIPASVLMAYAHHLRLMAP